MADFISDKEMEELEKKDVKSDDFISDKQMSKMERKGPAGLDSYTGAPVRQLIGSLQKGRGLIDSFSDARNAFGSNSPEIPTSQEIRKDLNIPNIPLAAGNPFMKAAGLLGGEQDVGDAAVAWGADLSNILPIAKGAKVLGKGASAINRSLDLSGKAAKAAGLLTPILTEKAIKTAVGGFFGGKLGGWPGVAAGAYLGEKIPDVTPIVEKAGKTVGGLLKGRSVIQPGPFKNFPAAPGTPLLTQKGKIPVEEILATLLRSKLAAERLPKDDE